MSNNSLTIRELLANLNGQGMVDDMDVERIANSLGELKQASKDPIYIRILSGFGAWFAALFLIGFLALSHLLDDSVATVIWGVMSLAAAIIVARKYNSTFLNQLCLALAFSGNILVLVGIGIESGENAMSVVLITHAVVCAVVYPLYASSTYRFLAPVGLATLATVWIFVEEVFVLSHFLIGAEAILVGIMFLRPRLPRMLTPLAFSAAIMLPATILCMNILQANIWSAKFDEPLWPSSTLLAVGLIYLYFHLSNDVKRLGEPWLILAIVSTILLGVFTTPGILVAIGLLTLGYAIGDRILIGLSYVFGPLFLFYYYYSLSIDLAHKSWIIAGSGVLLLAVRWIVTRWQPEEVAT